MGGTGSKGQKMFVSVLQRLLAERGFKVKESTTVEFYQFLMKVSPWFPEEGGLNLKDWKKVGREMRRYTVKHGEETISKQAYPIWLQMREILTEQSDLVLLSAEAQSEKDVEEPVYDLPYDDVTEVKVKEVKEKTYGTNKPLVRKDPSKTNLLGLDDDDDLSPGDWDDLEEEAARYHHDDDLVFTVKKGSKGSKGPIPAPHRKLLPPVGFAGAMAQAREQGDTSFVFPVVYTGDSDDEDSPTWEPLPLKTLKELQAAVRTMGPSAPYTIQIVDMVASQWLTPHDWHQTAKATLSPGDYILWRTEYEDKSKETVQKSSGKRGPKVTLDMMLGTGAFVAPASQVKIPVYPKRGYYQRCFGLESNPASWVKKDCLGRNKTRK